MADALRPAGGRGAPQIVSIGCYDLVDPVGWQPRPERFAHREAHAHNRLLTSVLLNADERELMAKTVCERLSAARGPVAFILPTRGGNEWDREGAPLADADGLSRFCAAIRSNCPANVRLLELDAHINDPEFSQAALAVVDQWREQGVLSPQA